MYYRAKKDTMLTGPLGTVIAVKKGDKVSGSNLSPELFEEVQEDGDKRGKARKRVRKDG